MNDLLKEALEIARGETMKIGTTEHVKALVEELTKVTLLLSNLESLIERERQKGGPF